MATIDIENLIEQKINEKLNDKINSLVDKAIDKIFNEEKTSKTLDEMVYPPKQEQPLSDEEFVKNEFERYLQDVANGLAVKWKEEFGKKRTPRTVGLYEVNFSKKDNNSEEETAFVKYMSELTWNKLQHLILNNAEICLEGLYDDNELIIPEVGSVIDTYYAIVKNTLLKRLSDIVEISVDSEFGDKNKNKLNTIIKVELSNMMNDLLDIIIYKHSKEIFDILFGKVYLKLEDKYKQN